MSLSPAICLNILRKEREEEGGRKEYEVILSGTGPIKIYLKTK